MRLESFARRIFLKDGRLRPVLRSVIYIVATLVGAGLLVALLAGLTGIGFGPGAASQTTYLRLFISELAFCAAAVGVAIMLRRYLDRRSVGSLGLVARGPWLRL